MFCCFKHFDIIAEIVNLAFLCYRHRTVSATTLWFLAVHPPHSFIWTNLVTTISHERLEQSRWNSQGLFISPYWWPE